MKAAAKEKLTPADELRLKIEKHIHKHHRNFKKFMNHLFIDEDFLYEIKDQPPALQEHLLLLPHKFDKSIRIECKRLEHDKAEIKVYDFDGIQLSRTKQIWMHEDFEEQNFLVLARKVNDETTSGAKGFRFTTQRFMINAASIEQNTELV